MLVYLLNLVQLYSCRYSSSCMGLKDLLARTAYTTYYMRIY
jgi:hypothetical protein